MEIEVACQCDGLPVHDHYMGQEEQDYGGFRARGPKYDRDDIGRIWVPWREVARALSYSIGPDRVEGSPPDGQVR